MSVKRIISNRVAYNLWANKQFALWLDQIDEALLFTKVKSSFETIGLTIQHNTLAQKFWLQFVSTGNPNDFNWKIADASKKIIFQNNIESSQELFNYVTSVNENDLLEEIELIQKWLQNKLPRYEYLLHVINHSTFHRGQIVTMARGLGVQKNIPATDYNFFNAQ